VIFFAEIYFKIGTRKYRKFLGKSSTAHGRAGTKGTTAQRVAFKI